MNKTFLLCYAPEPLSQVTESVLIYGRSPLRTKSRFPAKAVAMTPAITELRTVSWHQCDNFIVLTLDKAYTLYFLLSYLCKITVCRSSFAKTRFKRFPECLFSHRFLKLSAQSSSLLQLRESSSPRVPFSTTAASQCSVLLMSSSRLARYIGFPYSIRGTNIYPVFNTSSLNNIDADCKNFNSGVSNGNLLFCPDVDDYYYDTAVWCLNAI